MPARRTQLSLYVPAGAAEALEDVRRVVDPVQHGLIPAHVTLCRDEEVPEGLNHLASLSCGPLSLAFGRAEPFHGHGLLLPCVEGEAGFRTLREHVLGSTAIRELKPHLTLAHPRNPRAPGNSADAAAGLPVPLRITFVSLFLIEQLDGRPWRVLDRFPLAGPGGLSGR